MSTTLAQVMALVVEQTGLRRATPDMALDQDFGMAGGDVEDFAADLARVFGDQVRSWPWQRFASLDEGLSPLAIFGATRMLLTWPFRGRFSYPSPYERLTPRHIAAVIDRGEWFEP